mmetsp:Transcript_24921/g.66625  ORF Transcript_24921/g.66625 Transcript_24921/m.66625 type:complete len:235 (+) Transcript_24921:275-979(+)
MTNYMPSNIRAFSSHEIPTSNDTLPNSVRNLENRSWKTRHSGNDEHWPGLRNVQGLAPATFASVSVAQPTPTNPTPPADRAGLNQPARLPTLLAAGPDQRVTLLATVEHRLPLEADAHVAHGVHLQPDARKRAQHAIPLHGFLPQPHPRMRVADVEVREAPAWAEGLSPECGGMAPVVLELPRGAPLGVLRRGQRQVGVAELPPGRLRHPRPLREAVPGAAARRIHREPEVVHC